MKMKKIIFAIIIFLFINLFGIIISNMYFAAKLGYSEILGKPIYKTKNLKIYIPNKKWKLIKIKFPILSKSTKNIQEVFLGISILGASFILMLKRKTTHGSAKWAKTSDLKQSKKKSKKPFDLDLLKDSGVVLGRTVGNPSMVLYDNYSNTHVLIIGPTRSGKKGIVSTTGVSVVGSMVFLDIKGEIYTDTAGYRAKELDNIILKFDPMSNDSVKYNPLAEIRYMTEYEIEDSRRIADMIIRDQKNKSKGGTEEFFENASAGLLTAMIIYVLYKKDGKGCLGDVVDFITDTSDILINRMQQEIYEPIINSQIMFDKLSKLYPNDIDMVEQRQHPFISRNFSRAIQNPDKTFEGIVETLRTKLLIFELPMIKRNTSESDFRLWDLMNLDKPVSLYIRVDQADIKMLEPLINILVSQLIKVLTPRMAGRKVHKHKLICMFDEASQISLQEVEDSIPFVSGYGIKYVLVYQGLDQIYKRFTKENAIISNCQIQLYFTPTENTTAKYISEALGKETIKNTNINSNNLLNRSINNTDIGRELLTIDEVLQYPVDQGLLKIVGKPVIKTKKIYYWEDKEFKDKIDVIPPPEVEDEIKKLEEVKYGKNKEK